MLPRVRRHGMKSNNGACVTVVNTIAAVVILREMDAFCRITNISLTPSSILRTFKSVCGPAGTCLLGDNCYTACQLRLTTEALGVSQRVCHFTIDHT